MLDRDMTAFDSIREMSSFKSCRDETIARKTVGKILEAGRHAPSPGNVQSLEFIVVEDDHKKEMLSESIKDERMEHAPTVVIVVGDVDRMRRRVGESMCHDCCNAEAACAIQNMRIVASGEGIASTWVSGFDRQRVAEQFGLPDSREPLGVVAFGYTDDAISKPRKFSLNSMCYYDEYGNQVGSVFDGFEYHGIKESAEIFGRRTRRFRDKVRRKLRKFL